MKKPFPPQLPGADRAFDVVGLGGNAADTLVTIPRFPEPDTKAKFDGVSLQGGGRTATPMVALARLGFRTRYIGGVGEDAEGRTVLDSLRAEGVDVSGVRVRPGGLTQRAFILVEPDGRRTIVWGRSAGMPVGPEEIDEDLIASGRFFYTDAQDPRAAARAAPAAAAAGMPVLADIEDVRPGLAEFLPWVDYLVVSAAFPALATGAGEGQGGLDEACRILEERTRGALVVITQGAGGCLARIDGRLERFPAYAVEVRDTTGAGDLFHAGFAAACLRGLDLRDALDFSNAVAAMSCRELGGRAGAPRGFDEVERFRGTTPHRA